MFNLINLSKLFLLVSVFFLDWKGFIEPVLEMNQVTLLARSNERDGRIYNQTFYWEAVDDTLQCGLQVLTPNSCGAQTLYKVYKIDSIHSYYSIYCEKDDQKFKIISRKLDDDSNSLPRIEVGKFYNFSLQSFPAESRSNPLLNTPLLVDCFMLDERTKICKEPGINGLYTTFNLKGLFYLKNHN